MLQTQPTATLEAELQFLSYLIVGLDAIYARRLPSIAFGQLNMTWS